MNYEIKQEDKRTVAGFHLVGQTASNGSGFWLVPDWLWRVSYHR